MIDLIITIAERFWFMESGLVLLIIGSAFVAKVEKKK